LKSKPLPRIALTGSTGQVGSAVLDGGKNIWSINARFDSTETELLEELHSINPDVIINAAAYTAVDLAESNPQKCFIVNTAAVRVLIDFCSKTSSRLIHFSSDYVYGGDTISLYKENHQCCPKNTYGWSKYFADQMILASDIEANILRPSWVMGSKHENFVTKILSLGMNRDSLQIVSDQIGRPTSSKLLAEAALWLSEHRTNVPLMHISDEGEPTSWYLIAKYVLSRAAELGYQGLGEDEVHPISSIDYTTPANRPKNSTLDCALFDATLDIPRNCWTKTVDAIVEEQSRNW